MSRRVLAVSTLFFLLVTVLWYFFLLSPRNAKIGELLKKKLAYLDQLEGFVAPTAKTELSQGVLDAEALKQITLFGFEQRQEILAAGCSDMVVKPFRAHEIFDVMGRFLDLEYIYEPEREAAPARIGEVGLTSDMLADLPPELLQELRKTSLSLNRAAISAVIERIEPLVPV